MNRRALARHPWQRRPVSRHGAGLVATWLFAVALTIAGSRSLPGQQARAEARPAEAVAVFPIEVFVVVEDGEPVVPERWLDAQVEHARSLFASAGVDFEIEKVWRISSRYAHIATRSDRDALGRHPRRTGRIHLFLVRRLDDVDIADTQLFGVHWRFRRDRRDTWVILSSRDEDSTVLSHELGHLFELHHSRYRESIMNKRPRDEPPWPERVFADPEIERVRRQARRFVDSGRLISVTR